MNRLDEIKGAALDVAQHVTQDPDKRKAIADDLITLIGLMFQAVGKGLAIEGEGDMNDVADWTAPWDDGSFDPNPEQVAEFETERASDSAKAHNRYLVGEVIQREADRTMELARTADLERWGDDGWHPRCPECGERPGHLETCPIGNEGRCVGCGEFGCNGSCCITL